MCAGINREYEDSAVDKFNPLAPTVIPGMI